MRYYLFAKATTAEEGHKLFEEAKDHCNSYHFLTMPETGWMACRAKLNHEDAPEALEALGWVVWPHIIDTDAKLEDGHHVGIIDSKAGINSGDTPLQAAKKLYAFTQNHLPLKPTVLF
jgi:hypothetical protein